MKPKSLPFSHAIMATALMATTQTTCQAAPLPATYAIVETDPVRGGGDSGDDVGIWLHPSDLSKSLIIGTDSKNGIALYDLSGKELAFHPDGATGMVDVRYHFSLQGNKVDLVAAGNLSKNEIVIYQPDPDRLDLKIVTAEGIRPNIDIYGTCMYFSARTGEYYVIVTSPKGEVEQWRLFETKEGQIRGELARRFTLNPQGPDSAYTIEGCVADDPLGWLYLAQEEAGRIWRVNAEPTVDQPDPVLIDKPKAEGGHTVADVEGLALYEESDGTGYLIANNQGSYSWTVYTREGDNKYLMTFKIKGSDKLDAVTSDDSLDITNVLLNESFSKGLVAVEDGKNTKPGNAGNDNYKLVPWENIVKLAPEPLDIDVTFDPRNAGSSGNE